MILFQEKELLNLNLLTLPPLSFPTETTIKAFAHSCPLVLYLVTEPLLSHVTSHEVLCLFLLETVIYKLSLQ